MSKLPSPLKAIRLRCLDCCGFQPKEVALCPATNCPSHAFRMGKNPNRAGIGGPFGSISQKKPAEMAETKKEGHSHG